jgi:hypothetical protein
VKLAFGKKRLAEKRLAVGKKRLAESLRRRSYPPTLLIANRDSPTAFCQPPFANRFLPTAFCQLLLHAGTA